MKHAILKSLALTAASLAMATAASAADYSLSFVGGSSWYDVLGTFTTETGTGVGGGDKVLTFTGTITNESSKVSETFALSGTPGVSNDAWYGGVHYTWDNTYYGSGKQPLSADGLLFRGATSGKYFNLYGTGNGYSLDSDTPWVQAGGPVTITPVPEPETFAMLLAGLGLMGAIARRRNKLAAAV